MHLCRFSLEDYRAKALTALLALIRNSLFRFFFHQLAYCPQFSQHFVGLFHSHPVLMSGTILWRAKCTEEKTTSKVTPTTNYRYTCWWTYSRLSTPRRLQVVCNQEDFNHFSNPNSRAISSGFHSCSSNGLCCQCNHLRI